MVLTNDAALYGQLCLYRSHGITRDPKHMTKESDGDWYYQQVALGFNYRMTDIQAALGASQMDRLDEFVARRRALAARYDALLRDLPLKTPFVLDGAQPSWHLYIVRIDFDRVRKTKQQIFVEMRARGIALNLHYIPVHTQPYYEALGFHAEDCPAAVEYYREALTLPLYPCMTDAEQEMVAQALREVLIGG